MIKIIFDFIQFFLMDQQVNNITNESYYTNGYAVGTDRHFFVNPPLNFFATLKFKI